MPEYADNKPALMRAYKSADVGKNGYVELKEFADFIVLLKYYHEIGTAFGSAGRRVSHSSRQDVRDDERRQRPPHLF